MEKRFEIEQKTDYCTTRLHLGIFAREIGLGLERRFNDSSIEPKYIGFALSPGEIDALIEALQRCKAEYK
jgi:hypothetical protein